MANTILPGDRLVTFSRVGTIERGDIVVFEYPGNPSERHVNRIVALPGETVQLIGSIVLVNGEPIPERRDHAEPDFATDALKPLDAVGSGPYTVYDTQTDSDARSIPRRDGAPYGVGEPYVVPADACFVLGDNRDNSEDSRSWGSVPLDSIVGRVGFVWSTELGDARHLFRRID